MTYLTLRDKIIEVMPETGADSTGVGENPPIEAPQFSMDVKVPENIFKGHFRVFLASPAPRFGFGWTMDMTAKSPFFIGNLQILRSGAS